MPQLAEKTALITGGNSGIGFETAVALSQQGAHVVITSRDAQRGAAASEAIEARTDHAPEVMSLDLASFAAIRRFADEFSTSHDRLDILVLNAGAIIKQRRVSEDGHELQFQSNHLGHFLLTDLLRDQLIASAPTRIVVLSSDAHRTVRGLDFDDIESERRRYRAFRTYSRTKLMNLLFTRELARRLDGTGVTVNAVHPGFVASRFSRDGDTTLMGMGMAIARPFAHSPEVGAQTSVYVASSPDLDGVTGQYFAKSRLAQPSSAARDDAAATRLWEVSAKLSGVAS